MDGVGPVAVSQVWTLPPDRQPSGFGTLGPAAWNALTWAIVLAAVAFPDAVPAVRSRFGTVGSMKESEAAQREPGAQAAGDALAASLLAAQRLLCALETGQSAGDVRLRLQLRYAAICTSLKLPAADRSRAAERLDRLIADAELARRGESGVQVHSADNAEPEAHWRDYL
jgi:hypothetical protein